MLYIAYWSIFLLSSAFYSSGDHITSNNYQLYYDIIKRDKVIGFMKCNRVEDGQTIEYINESSATFSILIDISVYSKLQSSFNNGILRDGKLVRMVNGKTKANKHVSWSNNQYLIDDDGKRTSLKSAINFTTACLMFSEPSGMKYIFSENFGKPVAIEETAPHIYALKLPDGNDNIYTYQNGKCVEVEVRTAVATVYIRPHK
ncbi:MAG: hypothetical protein QM802_06920 [Agriterribacter sp.]